MSVPVTTRANEQSSEVSRNDVRRRGTIQRRRSIYIEIFAVTAIYLVAFELLIDPMRRGEATTIGWLFARFGSRQVSAVGNYSLLIASPGHRPILAYISSSCSSLMGILALGALAFTVLRSRRGHTLFAYVCAAGILFLANIVRMAASCLAGLWFGQGSLVLFHDWVGTVWNFVATLLGFLLLLYLALPTLERAEQDRIGRHVANRPVAWAQKGLGYPAPVRVGPKVHRATLTGWFMRHFVPRRLKRRLARQRESGRIDYRVGFLATEQRIAALRDLAADGLAAHGATFMAIATYDVSREVIEALVEVIIEHEVDTIVDARTVSLTLWARAWCLSATGVSQRVVEVTPSAQRYVTTRLFSLPRRARRKAWKRSVLDSPLRREALLRRFCEEGLGFNVAPLIAAAASEHEPDVLNALADAIAMRQWEPVVSPGVGALKLWAQAWTAAQYSSSRPTMKEVLMGPAPTPAPNHNLSDLMVGELSVESPAWYLRSRVVAVTGAGGAAGISVIRALLRAGHEVVAIDADPLAAGLHLAGVSPFVIPYADDPDYANALVEGLRTRRVDALICTVAEEYAPLRECAARLNELGCKTWLPDALAVETCLDKVAFARCLRQRNVAHPATTTSTRRSRSIQGPWIVKPRRGRGSRGVVALDRPRDVRRTLRANPQLIVQTRLAGREFTADVLVDRDGRLVSCVPRWRLSVSSGISVRGETFDSDVVTGLCAETLAAVGLTGVANVQGFVDSSGVASVVEVNPRFSGGLPLTLAAGADVVQAYLWAILHPASRLEPLFFTPGVRMLRHYEEIFDVPFSSHEPSDTQSVETTKATKRTKQRKRRKGHDKVGNRPREETTT